MLKKIGIGLFGLLLLSMLISVFYYSRFQSSQIELLESASLIADTAMGPIEYRIIGDSGPFILYFHGTPAGYDQPVSHIPNTRVVVPSRPGYLRTPIEVGKSPEEQAQAFELLINTLEIDEVIAMGASGGGPSSIAFASMFPERTKGLITLQAISQPTGDPNGVFRLPILIFNDYVMWAGLSFLRNFMGDDQLVRLLIPDSENQKLVLESTDKVLRMKTILNIFWPVSQRRDGWLNDGHQARVMELSTDSITSPTLIIHGSRDLNVPFGQSEKLAEQITGARLHVIEGGDHLMPISHSEEVQSVIQEFINSI